MCFPMVSWTVLTYVFKRATSAGKGLSLGGASMVPLYRISLYLLNVSGLITWVGFVSEGLAAGFRLSSSLVVWVVVGSGDVVVFVVSCSISVSFSLGVGFLAFVVADGSTGLSVRDGAITRRGSGVMAEAVSFRELFGVVGGAFNLATVGANLIFVC